MVVELERSLLEGFDFVVERLDFHNPATPLASLAGLARSPWNTSAANQVVEKAHAFGADLVHIHNTWYALTPAVITTLRSRGFPVVMTFHNYRLVCANAMLFRDGRPCEECVGGSLMPGVIHRCYRSSLVASTMVAVTIQTHRRRRTWSNSLSAAIALTEFARQRLLEGGLAADRTFVKPNFVTDPGSRTNRPSASNRILYVGRLSAEKGVDRLIDVWNTARPDELELVIAGTGPQEVEINEKSDESVRLLGRLSWEQVIEEMLAARALVVPSVWYEGQPMVILEALAAGLPVWHTDLGALSETTGGGGQSLGDGTQAAMEMSISRLGEDGLVDQLGTCARSEFETRFSPAHAVDALRRIYALARDVDPL